MIAVVIPLLNEEQLIERLLLSLFEALENGGEEFEEN